MVLGGIKTRIESQGWIFGRLVGIGDSCKKGDLPFASLAIEPFGIACLAYFQRRIDKDFKESKLTGLLDDAFDSISVFTIGTYKSAQADQSSGGHQVGDLADSANIFFSVLRGKPQPESLRKGFTVNGL